MATMNDYRTVTPYLVVPDGDAELKFIEAAFGATAKEVARNPEGAIMHAEISLGDSLIMLGQANEQWKALNAALYLWVPNVDETWSKALAAGATSISEPEDKPYGHRNAGVLDPSGVSWWIGAPVA
jgi:uncharacterized glyoxalase superfamily protein PhnB